MTLRYFFPALVAVLLISSGIPSFAFDRTDAPDYLPGRIIVKLEDAGTFFKQNDAGNKYKDSGRQDASGSGNGSNPLEILSSQMQQHGLVNMEPVFRSGASANISRFMQSGSRPDRLQELAAGFERTFTITYTPGEDPKSLSEEIARLPGVIYAEPHFVHETTDERIPDDPHIGNPGHDYFAYQNFYQAWAVSTGSPDVVIAIVDSGVYYEHPDLINKLWRNPEPGRADDFFPSWDIVNDTIGWNFWESGDVFAGEPPVQNGNPVGNYSRHGTHVAGTAAADTDNGEGIAGTGFHSQFMPVKVGGTRDFPRSIAYGFQGVLYAAINAADVINCSFGGTSFSQFGEDVVEFAIASGSVVVAAAGNNSDDVLFYPAAYDDVLTVGSVKRQYDDVISNFSNYGYYVDVYAMGEALLSTYFDYDEEAVSWTPTYERSTGTSMAAPVVSGLAALIKAENPDWTPQRIANQIRVNAQSLRAVNNDIRYENRLGMGLIDAHAALDNLKPGLRITDFTFEKPDGGKINTGESGTLTLNGINYGESASNPVLELTQIPDGISIDPVVHQPGAVPTNGTFTATFNVSIAEDFRLDEIPAFRMDISEPASDYNDFYMFEYERLLFDIFDINTIAVSISSDGTIGFLDAFAGSGGIGFIPADYGNVLYEGGLMITADKLNSANADDNRLIINQVRDSTQINRHFLPISNYRFMEPAIVSDIDGRAEFHSSEHPHFKQLEIEMETFAFDDEGTDQAFFIKYIITNNSHSTLQNMHVGLFNDWDIRNHSIDGTGFVASDSLIYAYDPEGAPYVAVAHMNAVSSAFAIDNTSPMSLPDAQNREDSLMFGVYYLEGEANYDGYTDAEKRLSLTAGTEQTTLTETDISIVTATGPFTLLPFARVTVGFIYGWGEDLDDLRSQISEARALNLFETSAPGEYSRFREISDRATLFQNFPNPFNSTTILEFHLSGPAQVDLSVYNVLGQRIATLVDEHVEQRAQFVPFDATGLASGVYIAVLRAEGRTVTMPMTLVK